MTTPVEVLTTTTEEQSTALDQLTTQELTTAQEQTTTQDDPTTQENATTHKETETQDDFTTLQQSTDEKSTTQYQTVNAQVADVKNSIVEKLTVIL